MKKSYGTNLIIILFALFPMLLGANTAFGVQDTLSFGQTFIIPDKPEIQTSVYDYAKTLKASDAKALETKLLNYADTTSTQIVIITIPSLQGESIGELTPRWAQKWGIGQAEKDNGILILLSESDREIWIAPGYGVDDRLTAGKLGEMIRGRILPEFKEGNYYAGLDKGTDAIFSILSGKYVADEVDKGFMNKFWAIVLLELFVFIVCFLYHFKAPAGIALAASALSSSGKSESPRIGFRGGFGGGGFSGGGAGGKW
ncbi:TPM domain-containing protein [Flavobacterium sp. MFBS3-15]|uniref:TPM domain-containing protein n=1 Tax=Flavobacterium sp. MFBS3-15 TaxID=2989816 RepID=UPI00223627B3|nr:TPM domain-containing protein [Flavobacterium sp. MFBS3-15]MCW4469536.1 TPM domain-containing protein [Flavobacterium sp. MFBS3-15]